MLMSTIIAESDGNRDSLLLGSSFAGIDSPLGLFFAGAKREVNSSCHTPNLFTGDGLHPRYPEEDGG